MIFWKKKIQELKKVLTVFLILNKIFQKIDNLTGPSSILYIYIYIYMRSWPMPAEPSSSFFHSQSKLIIIIIIN